jgi:hypothetical protein
VNGAPQNSIDTKQRHKTEKMKTLHSFEKKWSLKEKKTISFFGATPPKNSFLCTWPMNDLKT